MHNISMDSTALDFNPLNYVFEAEEEQEQMQQPAEGGQEQMQQPAEGGQEQMQQPAEDGQGEHNIEKLVDLESMQKFLLFRKVVAFKEEFETKLKYVEITDNTLIDPIRDILEVLYEFFPQLNIPQILAMLDALINYLDQFYKAKSHTN